MCDRNRKWVVTPKDGVNYGFEFAEDGSFIGLVPATEFVGDSDVSEVIADFDGDKFNFTEGGEQISYDGVKFTPKVVSYRFAELVGEGIILPVALRFMEGSSYPEGEVMDSNNVPVVVDSVGGLHVLKNSTASSKYYGLYALRNVPGGEHAWATSVYVPDTAPACLSGDYANCSFLSWLYSQGLNGQIMVDYD